MKTVLFFYTDLLLKQDKCDAYITPESNVDELISWRLQCLSREVTNKYLSPVTVRIIDKIDLSMIHTSLWVMFITRRGHRLEVEQIKQCSTSTGYNIYCFRNLSESAKYGPYICSAKGPDGNTCSFCYLQNMKSCIEYYLNLICCYA